MRVADLGSRRVAVWGLGREGRAAIAFLRRHHPNLPLWVLNDADGQPLEGFGQRVEYAFGAHQIASAIEQIEVIVKSPGVSLYRREIESARNKGIEITSLLNLWFAQQRDLTTICVTGTKGKSTTASLIAHILASLGRRVGLVGNIGVPITEIDSTTADFAVIEVSSYQAADFDGICDVAVLTSLYPEHIDWHHSVENYFRDKLNLLRRSRRAIVNREAVETVRRLGGSLAAPFLFFNDESRIHSSGIQILDGCEVVGEVRNPYLARPHNRSNLCAALTAVKSLGLDAAAALEAAGGFRELPHRQQELGQIGGLLFVDDSISTIPESTIAALAVYAGRPISVIVGGYDRGIDYRKLVESLIESGARAIICLGESGQRICSLAQAAASRRADLACAIYQAQSMADAVSFARRVTPPGGVILLSPAAPSYGHYRDYIERGRDFAAKAGLLKPVDISHPTRNRRNRRGRGTRTSPAAYDCQTAEGWHAERRR
jgi:UDP-N-acetylmuramoyl-L-alanine---L-glutamate ligase